MKRPDRKPTHLDIIKGTLTNFTAFQYAQTLVDIEKEKCTVLTFNAQTGVTKPEKLSYYEYLDASYGLGKNEPIELLIERNFDSALKEYERMLEQYTGFNKHGKVFILNKKEKFVSFLYDVYIILPEGGRASRLSKEPKKGESKRVTIHIHYNPLNVDCIEDHMGHDDLFGRVMNGTGDYGISLDEESLIKECDELIKNNSTGNQPVSSQSPHYIADIPEGAEEAIKKFLGPDVPILDTSDPDFEEKLGFAIWSTNSCADYRNDRDRPYDGQPWTCYGERGKTEVKGITFRDMKDCLIMAMLESAPLSKEFEHNYTQYYKDGKPTQKLIDEQDMHIHAKVELGTWREQDLYKINWDNIDPVAVTQNMTCRVEKMMGIFPNIQKLTDNQEGS